MEGWERLALATSFGHHVFWLLAADSKDGEVDRECTLQAVDSKDGEDTIADYIRIQGGRIYKRTSGAFEMALHLPRC